MRRSEGVGRKSKDINFIGRKQRMLATEKQGWLWGRKGRGHRVTLARHPGLSLCSATCLPVESSASSSPKGGEHLPPSALMSSYSGTFKPSAGNQRAAYLSNTVLYTEQITGRVNRVQVRS